MRPWTHWLRSCERCPHHGGAAAFPTVDSVVRSPFAQGSHIRQPPHLRDET